MDNKLIITGFADEIAPELSLQIETLKQLGINYIEMRGVNGRPLVAHSLDEVWEIKRTLDENGIKLSSVGSPIGKIQITDPFEDHFELFKRTVAIAKILNTRYIRMFSFFIPKGADPESFEPEVFARLEKFVRYAQEQDIVLLHENEKDIYGDNAPRCLKLMERFYGENFKAVFDFANFIQVGQPTLEAYEKLHPYIAYVHIKDALMDNGRVVPAGEGDGAVQEILSRLFASGYNGFLSLEPHLAGFTGFGALEKGNPTKVLLQLTGAETYTIAFNALQKILANLGVKAS